MMALVLALLLLCPSLVQAGTLTAMPGTWRERLTQLRPGDTLSLQAGHYGLLATRQTPLPSGTSWDAPITLQAAPGARVTFQGLDLHAVRYVVFDGLVIDASGRRDAVFLGQGADHIRFSNGEVAHATGQGISGWETVDLQLVRMDVHHNGTDRLHHGVYIAIPDTRIEESQFHHNSGYGIQIYNGHGCCAHNTVIQRNRIYANRGDGAVTLSHGNNILFRDNELWGNAGGGVQVSYGAPQGTQVVNNLIRDTRQGWGIEVSAQSRATVLQQNRLCNNLAPQLVDRGQGTRLEGNRMQADSCAGSPPAAPAPPPVPVPRGLRVLSR
jgi:parallel beta helix pectate lyase-like protein